MSITLSESGTMSVVPGARTLFAQLASEHAVKVAAEAGELATLHELCLLHDAVDEDAFGEAAENLVHPGADGTPAVAEYLALEVGALLGISDSCAATLLGQVLNCAHRHPLLWEAVQTGAVEWQRARLVVDEVTSSGLSAEAARWVDERITPPLMTLPRNRLRRKLHGLVALADPALARERELKARINRHVTFWAPTIDIGPCSDMTARLDLRDAVALDETINRLAEILATHGDQSTMDIRRATALGILADPEQALDLLNGGVPTPKRRAMTVVLHLSDASLADPESMARIDGRGPLSRETWTELLGHDHITIRPVVNPAMAPVDAYEIPDAIRDAVCFRSPSSVFPYGSQPSRKLDLDHTIPYDHSRGRPPAQTRVDNLGPLTRRAHRAKTARRWQVTQTEDGWFEWVSPAGYRYAVGPYGTLREARTLPATAA
ncbi:MAG: hypothetical protein ACOH16_14035 [Propionibacteriaceae bacterium]